MSKLFIGTMSGTSLDGIDIVVVKPPLTIVVSATFAYPTDIYQELLNLKLDLDSIATLDMRLGQFFAESINTLLAQHNINPKEIVAIGLHGQTIMHNPCGKNPYTIQIGNANKVAFLTQILTVADFRTKDIVAGGQGAPLVPAFHQAIFGNNDQAIVNIGGISNLTYLSKNEPTVGFDIGAGNCLLDDWIQKNQQKPYDKNGDWAKSGTVNSELLEKMLADKYFKLSPPKSTGREYFNLAWIQQFLNSKISAANVQATLSQLIAKTIAETCLLFNPKEILICGGGAKNDDLINRIKSYSNKTLVLTNYGINTDMLEAMAFAWLAKQAINGQINNTPSVTGATKALVLGVIYSP